MFLIHIGLQEPIDADPCLSILKCSEYSEDWYFATCVL